MTVQLGGRVGRHLALLSAVWIGLSAFPAAQHTQGPPQSTADAAGAPAQAEPDTHAGPPAIGAEYPSLHLAGFGNIDFANQDKSEGPRGFNEGQFVLHLVSSLSPQVNVFGELSFTPRTDAGTGSPTATGFNAEVERFIIKFDQSDELKVSFGRYHTPINWWNTAFHHGEWLQTTISRPEMVQFGGKFIPVHFVGALAEGAFPSSGWNLNYQVGIGNGRGNVISRGGDAGDNNATPAWVLNLFSKPDLAFGLQVGGSLYLDKVSPVGQPEFRERILAGHVVWQHEDPELIAEIANVRHEIVSGQSCPAPPTPCSGQATSNLAYYIQAAYRLPAFNRLWKPYYRFEHIDIDAADTVFAGIPNLDGSTLGVRYDISTYAALKTEGRWRQRVSGQPSMNGWFFQVSFTF